mgnify:CR=1 FL=1
MIATNIVESREARDAAIAIVILNNSSWVERALAAMPFMRHEFPETSGEGLRIWLLSNGLEEPLSPHAWGALTRTAMKRGILVDTGRMTQMNTKKSHARRTPLWRFA